MSASASQKTALETKQECVAYCDNKKILFITCKCPLEVVQCFCGISVDY